MRLSQADAGRLSRTSLATFATRATVALLGVAVSILIARALGPEGRGAYVVPITLAGLLITLLHLSLEQANVHLFTGRRATLQELAANSGLVASVAAVIGGGVVAALCAARPAGAANVPAPVWLAAFLVIPFAIHQNYLTGLLQMSHRIGATNRVALIGAAAQAGLIGILYSLDRLGVLAVVLVSSGVGILQWALGASVLAREVSLRPRLLPDVLARSLRFGLALHLGLLMVFLQLRADVFLVERYAGLAAVGLYSLAAMVAESVWMMTDAVAVATLPHLVAASTAEAGRLALRACRFNLLLACLGSAALALAAYPVIRFAYGAPFLPALPALLALLPGVVCYSVQRVCGAYLLRLDQPLRISAILGAAVLLNLGLNLAWIPHWGIVGAALASTASYALSAGLLLQWTLRVSGLGPQELFRFPSEDRQALRRVLTRPLRLRAGPGTQAG